MNRVRNEEVIKMQADDRSSPAFLLARHALRTNDAHAANFYCVQCSRQLSAHVD